jgi:hypothetical protein
MPIGVFVRNYLTEIFEYCKRHPDELSRLMKREYSKTTFNLDWPFCMEDGTITAKDDVRYWKPPHAIGDKSMRVCSQWFERHRTLFRQYLLSKGIAVKEEVEPARPPGNARLGGTAIGDVQNSLVRYVLRSRQEITCAIQSLVGEMR